MSPSTGRDDSDFYFAPTLDGATGSKASYTLDTKVQYRRLWLHLNSERTLRIGRESVSSLESTLRSAATPSKTPTLRRLRFPWTILTIVNPVSFPRLAKVLPSVISQPGFVAEADKRFHDINGIFRESEYFVLHGLSAGPVTIVTEPMIGVEKGANWKAQQADTYPDAILRADLGLRVVATIFQPSKAKPLFSIESNYIRRLLLNPEPIYTQDSKGNLVLSSVGTQPRDHVNVKLSYNLTKLVALTVAYEYGSLPPVFTKADNKYTFGITFKGQLQQKPANTAN